MTPQLARERQINRTFRRRFKTLTPEQQERWRNDPIQFQPRSLSEIKALTERNEAYWASDPVTRDPHPERYL